jgi:hypothetical protein
MSPYSFLPGDRVRISSEYYWARGAAGTIAQPPDILKKLVKEEPWQGHHRYSYVRTLHRLIELYWVWFDDPQFDADGDGPFRGGEFDVEVLFPLILH